MGAGGIMPWGLGFELRGEGGDGGGIGPRGGLRVGAYTGGPRVQVAPLSEVPPTHPPNTYPAQLPILHMQLHPAPDPRPGCSQRPPLPPWARQQRLVHAPPYVLQQCGQVLAQRGCVVQGAQGRLEAQLVQQLAQQADAEGRVLHSMAERGTMWPCVLHNMAERGTMPRAVQWEAPCHVLLQYVCQCAECALSTDNRVAATHSAGTGVQLRGGGKEGGREAGKEEAREEGRCLDGWYDIKTSGEDGASPSPGTHHQPSP